MSNSNQNEDRDDQNRLIGPEAEKLLSPQGREYMEQVRKDRANDPCPRKTQRDSARLQCAAAYTAGVSIPQSVRIELWECGLEDQDIDTWDRLRLIKRRGEPFTPEQEQEYQRICRLVERCLKCRCDDDGDPPDDDGPDFDRTVGDLIADARAKKDAEAEPAPVVPQPEPAPVLPDLTPKAKEKRKPKPRARRGKDDWGMG